MDLIIVAWIRMHPEPNSSQFQLRAVLTAARIDFQSSDDTNSIAWPLLCEEVHWSRARIIVNYWLHQERTESEFAQLRTTGYIRKHSPWHVLEDSVCPRRHAAQSCNKMLARRVMILTLC